MADLNPRQFGGASMRRQPTSPEYRGMPMAGYQKQAIGQHMNKEADRAAAAGHEDRARQLTRASGNLGKMSDNMRSKRQPTRVNSQQLRRMM